MNAASTGESGRRLAAWCGLLVAMVACWQGAIAVGFEFVEFDDSINLLLNPHLGPLSGQTLTWMFTDLDHMRRYVPLGWLGFGAVYGFSGLSPVGYHATGVALHGVNSALMFIVVWRVLARWARETDERWRAVAAGLAALGWSLHPFRAETLGWASGLLYAFSGCAALLSVIAYLRAGDRGVRRGRWVLAAAVLYLGSMLAYPMSLGLIGVFVLIDLVPPAEGPVRDWRPLVREKLWFFIPFVVVLGLTLLAGGHAPAFWGRLPTWAEFGWGERLLQMAAAWGYFVVKPLVPTGLTPVPTWMVDPGAIRPWALASLAAVLAVSLLLLGRWRTWRGAAVLWWAHASLLAPLAGFGERPYFPSDRYHYLAGGVLAVAAGLLLVRVTGRARGGVVFAAAGMAFALGAAQRAQLLVWRNTDTLMERVVGRAGHPAVRREFQERWIRHHANRGDRTRAAALATRLGLELEQVVATPPGGVPPLATAHFQQAAEFRRRERWTEAREHLRLTMELAPDWGQAAFSWALLRANEGAASEAWGWYPTIAKPGRGDPVPLLLRQRFLSLLAEGFLASGQRHRAAQVAELALREGGGGVADAGLEKQLRAQLAAGRAALAR